MTRRPSHQLITQYVVPAFIMASVLDAACAASPNDASSLQAFGDSPPWTVVVDASGMSLTIEEDGEPVFRELPAPAVSGAGKERLFQHENCERHAGRTSHHRRALRHARRAT